MHGLESVAIFWDYENCPVPSSTSGYSIVDNIRSIARPYGSVKSFKAYLEISDQAQKSLVLRSELQSSGVSLVDCPHNGRKDVADKMIIVDMFAHTIDTPAPSTVVLITGDRDFAYAMSTLRLRRYRVVLITLSNAHASLTAQASVCLDWTTHVLCPTEASLKGSSHSKQASLPNVQEKSRSSGMSNPRIEWTEIRRNEESGFLRMIREDRPAPVLSSNSDSTSSSRQSSQGTEERSTESTDSTSSRPFAKATSKVSSALDPASAGKTSVSTEFPTKESPLNENTSFRNQSVASVINNKDTFDTSDILNNAPPTPNHADDHEDLFIQPLLNQPVPPNPLLEADPGSASCSSTLFLPSILTGSSSRTRTFAPSKVSLEPVQPPLVGSFDTHPTAYLSKPVTQVISVPILASPSPVTIEPKPVVPCRSTKVVNVSSPVARETTLSQPQFDPSNALISILLQRLPDIVAHPQPASTPSPYDAVPTRKYMSVDSNFPYSAPVFVTSIQHADPTSKPTSGGDSIPSVQSTASHNNAVTHPPTSLVGVPLPPLPAPPQEYSPSAALKLSGCPAISPERATAVISSNTASLIPPDQATPLPSTTVSLPPLSPIALIPQTYAAPLTPETPQSIVSEDTSIAGPHSHPSSHVFVYAPQPIGPAANFIGVDDRPVSPPRPKSLQNLDTHPMQNGLTVVSSTPHPPLSPMANQNNITSTVVKGSTDDGSSPTIAQPVPLVVPENFRILVQCLQTYRSKGTLQPLRTKIAVEIAQNGTTYKKAGVQKFGQYVALAKDLGIIELGGWEGDAWICLNPDWYNATSSVTTEAVSIPTPSVAPKLLQPTASCTQLDTSGSANLFTLANSKSVESESFSPGPISVTLLKVADVIAKPSSGDDYIPHTQSAHLPDTVVSASNTSVIPSSPTPPEHLASGPKSASPPSIIAEILSGSGSASAVAAPPDPSTIKAVPEIFKILVQSLRTHRSKGILQPFRTNIAMELNEDKTTYAKAGVTRFGEYTALAEQQGIIELGGKEGGAWIRLHPNWYDATSSVIDKLNLASSSVLGTVYPASDTSSSIARDAVSASRLEPAAQPSPLPAILGSSLPQNAPIPVSPMVVQPPMVFSTPVNSYSAIVKGTSFSNSAPVHACVLTTPPQPVALRHPDIVPDIFKVLVKCLQVYRSKGVLKPSRTDVAMELNKNKAIYKRAGVDRFGPYTGLAEEQGIVELGGKEEGAWIGLKPKWYDAVAS